MRYIIIFLFITTGVYSQNLRFDLNQFIKDTDKGRVLMSSLTDSSLTYDSGIRLTVDSLLLVYGDTILTSASTIIADGTTGGSSSGAIYQQVFIADGIDSSYTVDGELPINSKDIMVTRNGLVLDTAFIESLTTSTVTLSFLPNAGNRINVIWFEVGRDTTWNKNLDDIYYTAGNVGVGTSTPDNKLTILGPGGTTDPLHIIKGTGTGGIKFSFNGTNYVSYIRTFESGILADNYMAFGVSQGLSSNAEVMRMKGSGEVLVGSTSNTTASPTFFVKQKFGTVASIGGFNFYSTSTSNDVNNNGIVSGAYYNGSSIATQTSAAFYQQYSGHHAFYSNYGLTPGNSFSAVERMTILDGEVRIAGNADRGTYNLQVNGTGVWGQGSYVNGSDIKLKENIKPINSGLYYVNKLKPVEYNYKPIYSSDPSRQLGFIAQDVIFALEDLSDAVVKDNGDIYSMAYQNLIPLAVKAIQEQQAIIETQNTKITELETALQALITRVEQLEQ